MCTVTVVPRADDGGFRLVVNRDERRSRPDATAPVWHRQGSRSIAYPSDPTGGGTWVGVNDVGLAMALLNRYPMVVPRPLPEAPSRGLIIPALLGCRRVSDAIQLIRAFDCSRFNAFRLVVVDRQETGVFTHDARGDSAVVETLSKPLLQTSSSLGDDLVEPPRRRLFEELVLTEATPCRLLGQHRFHRLQWTSRPEISVFMERPDARTVSRTRFDFIRDSVGMVYERVA
jgi:uncharacterized protein with NRDE domain